MSQMFMLPSLELLLIAGRAVALLLGLLIFAWAFRHWRRAAMRDTQRVFEQLDLVRSELLIMKEVMHHSSHRETSHRETAHRDAGRWDSAYRGDATPHDTRLPVAAVSGAARGYENAARMARNGAGKDELIRSCGVTSHEAELLLKLHGQRSALGAELLGRQPRTAAATRDTAAIAAVTRPQSSAQAGQNQTRQAATPARQIVAAGQTQRTPAAPIKSQAKSQGLPPRSRLVAVG